MSWWIALVKDGEQVTVESFSEGGTQVMGGSTEASLNVTYNYSDVTRLVGFNFDKSLDGQHAAAVIPELERVVKLLGTHPNRDYWAPTPGNAGRAANTLLEWAKQHPNAVFEVH